jgi:hypothetical protein
VAWGLGTEAPTRAEAQKNIEQQKDLLRERGIEVPATARTETPMARQPWWNALDALASSIRMVFGVRSGLRNPRRLTVLATAAREHRETARHLPMNPFMSPGRVVRRTLRTE